MEPSTTYQDKLPYDQIAIVIAEGGILTTVVLPLALLLLVAVSFVILLTWRRAKEWNEVGVAMRFIDDQPKSNNDADSNHVSAQHAETSEDDESRSTTYDEAG